MFVYTHTHVKCEITYIYDRLSGMKKLCDKFKLSACIITIVRPRCPVIRMGQIYFKAKSIFILPDKGIPLGKKLIPVFIKFDVLHIRALKVE